MQQDKIITDFLNNEFSQIWSLIINNQTDTLIDTLIPKKETKTLFEKLFSRKKESAESTDLHLIINDLFTSGESKTLQAQEFRVMNSESDKLFKNLTRLLFAVSLSGKHSDLERIIQHKLHQSTRTISDEINTKSNGYPLNSINAQVWLCGAGMRAGYTYLLHYYKIKGLVKEQLFVARMKTTITLSIMGHYKDMVGPDMIAVAELEEKINSAEVALDHYKAVIADFEDETEFFMENPEEAPNDAEREILSSLLKSYQNVDRLENTDRFEMNINQLNTILNRQSFEDLLPDEYV
jgi:hypothetical protein